MISIFVRHTYLFFSNPYILYVYSLIRKILQVYFLDSVSSGMDVHTPHNTYFAWLAL